MKNKTHNRYEVTVKDTQTGDILIKMHGTAICATVANVICDGKGFGMRQICTHDTNEPLLLKYTYKSAKVAAKVMKKKYKFLKKEGQ